MHRNQALSKSLLCWMLLFTGLYVCSLYNYLLFHSMAELFSIVVAFSIFIFTWHSKHMFKNGFFLFIGITYFFTGFVDLFHTLTYKGINVFPEHSTNLPTQLWISARYIQSISLFSAIFFIDRKLNENYLFILLSTITSLILLSIFEWQVFPVCYLEQSGLTIFKKVSEYFISLLLLITALMLRARRSSFIHGVYRLICVSIVLTICSELIFTIYLSVFDIFNFTGHFLKILASYLILKAIIEMGLVNPYNLLFDNLLESQDELKKLYKAVEQSADMIVITNTEGIIEYINPAFEVITGFTKSEVLGKKPALLKSGKYDQKFYETLWSTILNKEVFQYTFINKRKDGSLFYEDKTITPITNEHGSLTSFISIGRDITARKRAEHELIERSEELVRSNQELEQYAYVASHDLLEPLRMTTNYAQMLSKKYADSLDDNAQKYINYILNGVHRMRTLITDLLSFSRITTQGKKFISVSMNKVLKTVISNLEPVIEESNAKIYNDMLPTIVGDRTQMIQLLQNLIGNSIKFRGRSDPEIHIRAKQHQCSKTDKTTIDNMFNQTQRTAWLFCVSDNGIGIEPQHIERIFNMFERLHSRDKYDGTGIGLPICKKIVERHGGNIWAESECGKGTSFYFILFS
ncbi:MAG: ATP-binding protein [Nitrospirae bacterium YQR-1]